MGGSTNDWLVILMVLCFDVQPNSGMNAELIRHGCFMLFPLYMCLPITNSFFDTSIGHVLFCYRIRRHKSETMRP